jgi:phosphoglycerol transferase MdoB-like AlkP superfamily enzyme
VEGANRVAIADGTEQDVGGPRRPRAASRAFPLLLGGHLVVAGFLGFDLFTSDALEIALHWVAVVVGGVWALLVWRAYARSAWRERHPGFARLFPASVATALASALVLFALIVTVDCKPHEVERYIRALLLSVSVYPFANAAVAFALMSLVYLGTGRAWTSIWLGAVLTATLLGIHVAKYLVLQQHLYPWDYMLATDLAEILPVLLGTGGLLAAAAGFVAVLVVAVALARRERARESVGRRAVLFAGSVLTAGVLFLLLLVSTGRRDPTPHEYFPLWNRLSYNSHHNKSGFCFALLRGARHLWINRPPDGYSAAAMERIARAHPPGEVEVVPTADVILYMVESLGDLASYGLTYRTDPIPNFHGLVEKHGGGRLMVPTYGGSTSNTEFEALTGLSRVRPWPHQMVHAYRQWLTEDTPSLAWVFRDWGYRTAVVSGATGRYFAQRTAYPRLGFQAFHALGDREGVPERFGLVSDDAVVDEIIAILRGNDAGAGRGPWFLSVATDASHAPYDPDRVPADERFALVDAEHLPPDVRDFACRYGTALRHADEALGRLVRFLEARGDPALLLVYGDHKPPVGALFEAGVLRGDWPGAVVDKFSTPLAIWSNLPRSGRGPPLFLSANFLSAEIFGRLGVRHPPSTFRFTQAVYEAFSVVSHVVVPRGGAIQRPGDLRGELAEILRDYGLVKYDVLVGSRRK